MKLYQKHVPEGQEIKAIIHEHWITVMDSFILWVSFWVIIPSFLYYQSIRIQEYVPFIALEALLFIIFLKIVYELFNWYNDVWIVTEHAVYDLEWSLLKSNVESIHFENIEWVEIDKHRIWDNIFNKGDVIIHKFGEESLAIYNAYSPYKAVDIIEGYIHPMDDDEPHDRFDMIMDTLSGVVTDYLERNGLKDSYDNPETLEDMQEDENPWEDEYTIDIRK